MIAGEIGLSAQGEKAMRPRVWLNSIEFLGFRILGFYGFGFGLEVPWHRKFYIQFRHVKLELHDECSCRAQA